jgi:hypothetical protein
MPKLLSVPIVVASSGGRAIGIAATALGERWLG